MARGATMTAAAVQRHQAHAEKEAEVGYPPRHFGTCRMGPMAVCALMGASVALSGMLGVVSAAPPHPARHVPDTDPAVRGRGRGRGRGREDSHRLRAARGIGAGSAEAQPVGSNDNNDNNNDKDNYLYPFDLLSPRHLKEEDNAEEPAADLNDDPDDDRVQACGLQWDRSISCGGKADKKDVVPVCCPGYRCEGEWCVLPEPDDTDEPTLSPTTEEPTDLPTPLPTEVPTPMPTEVPTPMPTEMPTQSPTGMPTTDPPVAAAVVAVAVVETPSPVSPDPTSAPISPITAPVVAPPPPTGPTPPPQPLVPPTGILTVPLGSPTAFTYTFPRSSFQDVNTLSTNLVAEVTKSFLDGRFLALLDDKKSDYELVDGIDFAGVRLDVVEVRYENLDQIEEELREAGLLLDDGEDDNKKNNNGKDRRRNLRRMDRPTLAATGSRANRGHRVGSSDAANTNNNNGDANNANNVNAKNAANANDRQMQQAPAFSIGRPKAIVILDGEARFRISEKDLLVPAPGTSTTIESDAQQQQFVLADPTDVPDAATLWDIQQLIWAEDGASDDFLELVMLAGEASRDVVGTVNFVKIEQDALVIPTMAPTGTPTARPTLAPVVTTTVVGVVEEEEVEDIVFVAPTDGDGAGDSTDGGFIPLEPESAQPDETGNGNDGTFIPAAPETSTSSTSAKNASEGVGGKDSTVGIVIGVVAALVVGLAILAFFLVKRQRKLEASAELVDKARADKIRREGDLSTPTTGGAANEDGIEVGYKAETAAAGGGGGGWLSSKFRPRYLSPGRANKNRPDPSGQRSTDGENSSLGSSSLGNGTATSKESWAKRVRSNLSVGGSTLRGGADDCSLEDDFSVGAESIGGKAAGPAFTGDDEDNVNMLGEIGMDDDVDVTRGYDMNRTETAQSTWSFSGVGGKRSDPPAAVNPPNYGVAVAPQRSDLADGEETEFAPDTRILNDDESALLDDDFDREFNRKPSDLTHISRGPGAIRSRQTGSSRYNGGSLPTHNEPIAGHGSPAPPPPAYSPPKKQSPGKLLAGSMLKRGTSLRQTTAPHNQATPSRANTAKAKTSPSYEQQRASSFPVSGYANTRDSFDDRGMGGSGARSSISPTGSASSGGTPTDLQRKRMEARKKMQMQMEYDAPSGASPRYASAGGSGGSDTRYREIKQSYSSQSEATEQARNDNGETVLEDLNKLSGFLKERKEQQALREGRGGSDQRPGSHRTTPSSTSGGGSGPKTVSSFMKDRGY